MKHLKTLLLVAIFTIGLGGVANAQKIAHINTDKLLAEMPETKALKAELEKLRTTYRNDIEGMFKKLEAKFSIDGQIWAGVEYSDVFEVGLQGLVYGESYSLEVVYSLSEYSISRIWRFFFSRPKRDISIFLW